MKKIIYVIALIFCSTQSHAQSNCDCFDRLYSLSIHYSTIDSEQKSVEIMKDAISFLELRFRYNYYHNVGSSFAYLKQFDSAVKYYSQAVSEGGYPLAYTKGKYPDVYNKLDTIALKNRLKKHTAELDLDLFARYSNTIFLDQAVRGLLVTDEDHRDTTNAGKRALVVSLFERTDSATFEFVRYMLEHYKYPSFQMLHFNSDHLMAMILHMTAYSGERSDYIYSKLAELNRQCEFPQKSAILFMKERYAKWNEGGKTHAGMMGGSDKYMNIVDITKADSLRLQYNRLRIKEDRNPGEEVPKNYVPIPYPKNYFCLKKYNGLFK